MKRKLRFFCDYCADSPLWESFEDETGDWPDGEYNKSKESLSKFGVSSHTIGLMDTLQCIYEYPVSDERFTKEEVNAYKALRKLILKHLDSEIGDKFEIQVVG